VTLRSSVWGSLLKSYTPTFLVRVGVLKLRILVLLESTAKLEYCYIKMVGLSVEFQFSLIDDAM